MIIEIWRIVAPNGTLKEIEVEFGNRIDETYLLHMLRKHAKYDFANPETKISVVHHEEINPIQPAA